MAVSGVMECDEERRTSGPSPISCLHRWTWRAEEIKHAEGKRSHRRCWRGRVVQVLASRLATRQKPSRTECTAESEPPPAASSVSTQAGRSLRDAGR